MKNITDKVTSIKSTIETMLRNEMVTDGILSDVEELCFGRKININDLDYPCVWVIDDNISSKEAGLGPKSIEIDTMTVGFFCLAFDADDSRDDLSCDLALRVLDTLEKYCLISDEDGKIFDYVKFVSIEPAEFPVSSSNTITQYGLTVEFGFRRQRIFCNNR